MTISIRSVVRCITIALMTVAVVLPPITTVAGGICGEDNSPLFVCETGKTGKFISICAKEEISGEEWSTVQYRFGKEGGPEMAYPPDPADGSRLLFFSHYDDIRGWYRVSVRFNVGDYTYRVYSIARGKTEGDAGVVVSDRKGKMLSDIKCIERPYMFPSYLQRALACDLKNPHGKAACNDSPYRKMK